mgnify:CR=1 FL=1
MIKVKEYRGHIRNWEELCERLDIPLDLTREEREEQILVKAYETWDGRSHARDVCLCPVG